MTAIEAAIAQNTAITRKIEANTAGFIAFSEDLENGTRLLCRIAKGITFVLDAVKKYWMPVLICIGFLSWLANGFRLPPWAESLLKVALL